MYHAIYFLKFQIENLKSYVGHGYFHRDRKYFHQVTWAHAPGFIQAKSLLTLFTWKRHASKNFIIPVKITAHNFHLYNPYYRPHAVLFSPGWSIPAKITVCNHQTYTSINIYIRLQLALELFLRRTKLHSG